MAWYKASRWLGWHSWCFKFWWNSLLRRERSKGIGSSFLGSYGHCDWVSGPTTLLKDLFPIVEVDLHVMDLCVKSLKPLKVWCTSAVERLCLNLLRHCARTHVVWTFAGTQRRVPSTLQWSWWCSHSPSDLCRSFVGCQPFFGCYRNVGGIHAPSVANWRWSFLVDLHTKMNPSSDSEKAATIVHPLWLVDRLSQFRIAT